MIPTSYQLELISPCFAGGAEPEKQAEIRAPSIRGQLRWWFRVLGGFASLSPLSVREQEERIFGSASGTAGTSSPLIVRVNQSLRSKVVRDADGMGAAMNSSLGYLLFPLRTNPRKNEIKARGVFQDPLPSFSLQFLWRGDPSLRQAIDALAVVFGHLGSLGFRSRRAMGALSFRGTAPDLSQALAHFARPNSIVLRCLEAASADQAISKLAEWLKAWRSYGRTGDHPSARPPNPPHNPGFTCAKADHDAGLAALAQHAQQTPTFRPALGLPIVQFFSSKHQTAKWEYGGPTAQKKGRFASPILLRPYRSGQVWKGLIIFVETQCWPNGRVVYVEGQPRPVSSALYDKMKNDPNLALFP